MSRKPTDLSNKTLGDIRRLKESIGKHISEAVLRVVREEQAAYGIVIGEVVFRGDRATIESEQGLPIHSAMRCEVNVNIIGAEL